VRQAFSCTQTLDRVVVLERIGERGGRPAIVREQRVAEQPEITQRAGEPASTGGVADGRGVTDESHSVAAGRGDPTVRAVERGVGSA
jgi:hypothetical protein